MSISLGSGSAFFFTRPAGIFSTGRLAFFNRPGAQFFTNVCAVIGRDNMAQRAPTSHRSPRSPRSSKTAQVAQVAVDQAAQVESLLQNQVSDSGILANLSYRPDNMADSLMWLCQAACVTNSVLRTLLGAKDARRHRRSPMLEKLVTWAASSEVVGDDGVLQASMSGGL